MESRSGFGELRVGLMLGLGERIKCRVRARARATATATARVGAWVRVGAWLKVGIGVVGVKGSPATDRSRELR